LPVFTSPTGGIYLGKKSPEFTHIDLRKKINFTFKYKIKSKIDEVNGFDWFDGAGSIKDDAWETFKTYMLNISGISYQEYKVIGGGDDNTATTWENVLFIDNKAGRFDTLRSMGSNGIGVELGEEPGKYIQITGIKLFTKNSFLGLTKEDLDKFLPYFYYQNKTVSKDKIEISEKESRVLISHRMSLDGKEYYRLGDR